MKLSKIILASFAVLASLASCTKNEDPASGTPSITVNGEKSQTLSFTSEAGQKTVTIVSNRAWKLQDLSTTEKEWITVDIEGTQAVTKGQSVTVAVSGNSGQARTASLVFTTGTTTATLNISQASGVQPKDLPYSESFAASLGDFTIQNKSALPTGFSYIWKCDTQNKYAKASGGTSTASYDAESWLVSPELKVADQETSVTFSFAQNYGSATEYANNFYGIILDGTDTTKVNFKNPSSGSWNYVNDTISLAAFNGKTIQFAFVYKSTSDPASAPTIDLKNFRAGGPIGSVEPTKIADLLAAEDGTTFTDFKTLVSEVGTVAYLVTDGTDNLFVFQNSAISVAVGDSIKLSGKIVTFNGIKQVDVGAIASVIGSGYSVPTVQAEDITSTFGTFSSTKVKYVKVSGTIVKNGNNYNINVPDVTAQFGTIAYPKASLGIDSKLSPIPVEVEGWYLYTTGSSTKYVKILASKITASGNYLSLTPESATVAADVTSTTFNIGSNTDWTITCPEGITASPASGNGDAEITLSFSANPDSTKIESSITVTGTDLTPKTFTLTQKGLGGAGKYTYADFETIEPNNKYDAYSSKAGWAAANSQILAGYAKDSSNVYFQFIGLSDATGEYAHAVTINGKTTSFGTITSPTLKGGCGTIVLKYGYAYSESKGVKFKIEVKQSGTAVKTFEVNDSKLAKATAASATFDANVTGDFTIVVTNLSPTNSTSNKDRYSIWDLGWTAYKDK